MKNNSINKSLLLSGLIACPLFIVVVLTEGATRPGYNSFLYPLSSLSIGVTGWIQISNFIITGILIIIFSFGLSRVFNSIRGKFRGPLLIRLVGVGLVGAGIFVTDPLFGYPIEKPLVLRQFTFHGHLHDAFSMFVFICLPWACFVFQKWFGKNGERGWAIYSSLTGFTMIVTFVFSSMGFKQLSGFVDYAGVFQRLCISIGLIWIGLLALYFLRGKELDK